jgi:xanthine dehydrogenase accessory factor
MTPELRIALMRARTERRPVVLATDLASGRQLLWPGPDVPEALAEAAREALAADRSATIEQEGARWFLHVHTLPLRLFLIGAVHIAQGLAPFAETLGFQTTVIDPRPSLATPERFPGITLMPDWPDEALDRASLDGRSAVVALTHDPKLDDPALDRALRSDAFYIGALGSRRSHAARLERLAEFGHGPESLSRIKGPVGLPLAAVTAAEIALSIAAEIVAVRRGSSLSWARR